MHTFAGVSIVAAASSLFFSSIVSALNPIVIKGNAFFDSRTNERFYIRGVDYQVNILSLSWDMLTLLAWWFFGCELRSFSVGGVEDYADIRDIANCQLNIPYMQKLGLNAIRVYSVDNSADHRECMALLDQAGIYVILDGNILENRV
jgi:1,3-beta-glucanosyltransferase GAS5